MKKLISIGIVLALVAIVVLPVGVGAQPEYPCPQTYAKIPFAIVQSGLIMVGSLLDLLSAQLGLPAWLNSTVLNTIGGWAGGPLAWSVDMVAWGLGLVSTILNGIADTLGLPTWLAPTVNNITEGLRECYSAGNCTLACNCTPTCPP